MDDNVSLPVQRLREELSELIKTVEDKDTAQELLECNRRLSELRQEVAVFLSQSEEDHVYWVERSGRAQRNFALNAAPVEVSAFLRRRLFGADTSVIMTSATLSTSSELEQKEGIKEPGRLGRQAAPVGQPGLNYFARQVGAEKARLLQVGSPFDYARQMKLFVAGKMPDPREPGYQEALIHWIEHFITHDARQSLRAVHQFQADAGNRATDAAVF